MGLRIYAKEYNNIKLIKGVNFKIKVKYRK